MFRKRQPKGSPVGGQFAPDARGKNPPAGNELESVLEDAGWDPSWELKDYAARTDVAFQLYQEQVRNRTFAIVSSPGELGEWGRGVCSFCGEMMTQHAARCKMRFRNRGGYISQESLSLQEPSGFCIAGSLPRVDSLRTALGGGRVAEGFLSTRVGPPSSEWAVSYKWPMVQGEYRVAWAGLGKARFLRGRSSSCLVNVDTSDLKCSCPVYAMSYHCEHIDVLVSKIVERVGEEPRTLRWWRGMKEGLMFRSDGSPADEEAETFMVVRNAAEAVLWDGEKRQQQLKESAAGRVEAAAGWRRDAEVLYSGDYDAFVKDMEEGIRRWRTGESVTGVYEYENVLDGACQRGSGQAFGMEIEYDYPAEWSSEYCERVDERIGRQLFEAGLTGSPDKQRYGASHGKFVDRHTDDAGVGTWSWEKDGSVAGELVTCGMYDEPETWKRVEKAVGILRRNGAVASVMTGAHVHVGTGDYDAAEYVELMRLTGQNEDAFVVLGTDPHRRTHRANEYSAPMEEVPPSGFRSVSQATRFQGGRHKLVNLGNCTGEEEDHVEFRVFDGTLDASVMQFQVKLAVGMVEAAKRRAAEGGSVRKKEAWGDHVKNSDGFSAGSCSRSEDDSVLMRSLLDTVFRRRGDKAKGAALCAMNRWSVPGY